MFYFLTDCCCCCKQYQKIGKVLRRSPVDISRQTMELDRDPEEASASLQDQVHNEPIYGGYYFVFVDKLSPGQIWSICLFARRMLSRPRVSTLLTNLIPWLSMTISMTFWSFPWPNVKLSLLKTFLVLAWFLTLKSSTDKLQCPPKCVPFRLSNYYLYPILSLLWYNFVGNIL